MRQAQQVCLAAFVASRLASRPHVSQLAADMEQSGLATRCRILEAYDARTADALERLVRTLASEAGSALLDKLEDAAQAVGDAWANLFEVVNSTDPEPLPRHPRRSGPGAQLLPDDGDMDFESPTSQNLGRTLRIQHLIMGAVDAGVSGSLEIEMQAAGDFTGLRRLGEPAHGDVDHSW